MIFKTGKILYSVSTFLYHTSIRIASLFNLKAKEWVVGRKETMRVLANYQAGSRSTIWFHCASLGEFEQGRPLIEKWRKERPDDWIVLTFFSPSGYRVRKNYQAADMVLYLPIDHTKNANYFIERINPSIALFIKYEFWASYLDVLQQQQIPTLLISSIFRKDQLFFKWYGSYYLSLLLHFDAIHVQDADSSELLASKGISSTIIPDLRFDRVLDISRSTQEVRQVQEMAQQAKVLVAGSTWPADESLLAKAYRHFLKDRGYKLVIAPHEVNEAHLQQLEKKFNHHCSRLSDQTKILSTGVLIIDSIGLLSTLYKYGSVQYIGGGFGAGIHNCLEAAVYGKPILFGPKYLAFKEARDLISKGAAQSIQDERGLIQRLQYWEDDTAAYHLACTEAATYVQQNGGGTEQTWKAIADYLPRKP